jgi:excisionase family DNA binding protein
MTNDSAPLRENRAHIDHQRTAFGELLNVSQAAEILGCSENTVRNMVHRQELPAVRVGTRIVRIRRSDFDECLHTCEGGQAGMWGHLR